MRELAARAMERSSIEFTRFLDPREQKLALGAAKSEGAAAVLWGNESAERRICAFDGRLWLEDSERRYDWPAVSLEILWDGRFASLAHRDILGALLALGIGRESIGDIGAGCGRAAVWVLEGIAPFILSNLTAAGRAAVTASIADGMPEDMPRADARQLRGSVQSLRLDAVVAEAFGLARADAARAVKSGLVKLNHAEETRTDWKVAEGALLSVKGMGRARLIKASEHTKRSGRTIVEFEVTF
jgi:RNA-binding protein YlmH